MNFSYVDTEEQGGEILITLEVEWMSLFGMVHNHDIRTYRQKLDADGKPYWIDDKTKHAAPRDALQQLAHYATAWHINQAIRGMQAHGFKVQPERIDPRLPKFQ